MASTYLIEIELTQCRSSVAVNRSPSAKCFFQSADAVGEPHIRLDDTLGESLGLKRYIERSPAVQGEGNRRVPQQNHASDARGMAPSEKDAKAAARVQDEKTCPRCPSQDEHRISTRRMPQVLSTSVCSRIPETSERLGCDPRRTKPQVGRCCTFTLPR